MSVQSDSVCCTYKSANCNLSNGRDRNMSNARCDSASGADVAKTVGFEVKLVRFISVSKKLSSFSTRRK